MATPSLIDKNVTFCSLLRFSQTPAEQAKVRMQMVLQAAGKCINPADVSRSLAMLNRKAVYENTVRQSVISRITDSAVFAAGRD